jgi:NAD(P)-dependent dehydrogenase (short-subunit alcohol dehydrogenase family)
MKAVYIITGASSPLGIDLYKSLLKKKVPCVLVVRDASKLDGLEAFDESSYEIWESDLESDANINELCRKILLLRSEVAAFIHLAASSNEDDFDIEKICKTFKVNVFSAWKLAKICIDKMSVAKGGRILFVGSIGHRFGGKHTRPGYSGSKYLLEYFPKPFRECAARNVLVNTLRLGVMQGGTQAATGISGNAFSERLKLIPTGKYVSTAEAVRNILFLCSIKNESIHNAVFSCSGGE